MTALLTSLRAPEWVMAAVLTIAWLGMRAFAVWAARKVKRHA